MHHMHPYASSTGASRPTNPTSEEALGPSKPTPNTFSEGILGGLGKRILSGRHHDQDQASARWSPLRLSQLWIHTGFGNLCGTTTRTMHRQTVWWCLCCPWLSCGPRTQKDIVNCRGSIKCVFPLKQSAAKPSTSISKLLSGLVK